MTFSEKLKLAMTERNIKPVELALKIGKNKSSVSQYLSGINIPKDSTKEKICEVLDVPLEYFNEQIEDESKDTFLYNVPIKEAARLLHKSEQFVRVSLQQGTAPFGFATKKEGKEKYSYHISPKKLYEYVAQI